MAVEIDKICAIAVEAGKEILNIYESSDFEVEMKSDNSPLTIADKRSHSVIKTQLELHYPDIPVLSEEGREISYAERKNWNPFWLVDPLDGTKEFIKRNGEFTVNIALIENNLPVLGVIYAPVPDTLYYANQSNGAYIKHSDSAPLPIHTDTDTVDGVVIVRSRSHALDAEEELYSRYTVKDEIAVGSSLKFCMLAEGKAHVYYRHGPTMEWDTAAGHAIANAAGARVTQPDGSAFTYNKPELLNGPFLASVTNV